MDGKCSGFNFRLWMAANRRLTSSSSSCISSSLDEARMFRSGARFDSIFFDECFGTWSSTGAGTRRGGVFEPSFSLVRSTVFLAKTGIVLASPCEELWCLATTREEEVVLVIIPSPECQNGGSESSSLLARLTELLAEAGMILATASEVEEILVIIPSHAD